MKNDYKDGFYYVNSKISGEQSIAQREQGSWWMIGCSERLNSDDFTPIMGNARLQGYRSNGE